VDRILEQFKEAIGEKYLLTKLLLHSQEAYEECEMLLRHFLSEDDVARLISKQSPFKGSGGSAMVGVKYLQAVYEHTLWSNSVNPRVVCQNPSSILSNC
jgi:hypothetical protein